MRGRDAVDSGDLNKGRQRWILFRDAIQYVGGESEHFRLRWTRLQRHWVKKKG
jgi:hypothetical protein